jgi:hypothetical protein
VFVESWGLSKQFGWPYLNHQPSTICRDGLLNHKEQRRNTMLKNLKVLALFAAVSFAFACEANDGAPKSPEKNANNVVASPSSDAEELKRFRDAEKLGLQHIATFDALDFDVFTSQNWDRLKESHGKDVKVHWPDGRVTEGIDKHIDDLKFLFSFAPDTRILEHPIKLHQGEWTSVVGYMEGTFTKPMKVAEGREIAPTGKPYRIRMATVSHWGADGTMTEEYLFWDNQDFNKQIGLGN